MNRWRSGAAVALSASSTIQGHDRGSDGVALGGVGSGKLRSFYDDDEEGSEGILGGHAPAGRATDRRSSSWREANPPPFRLNTDLAIPPRSPAAQRAHHVAGEADRHRTPFHIHHAPLQDDAADTLGPGAPSGARGDRPLAEDPPQLLGALARRVSGADAGGGGGSGVPQELLVREVGLLTQRLRDVQRENADLRGRVDGLLRLLEDRDRQLATQAADHRAVLDAVRRERRASSSPRRRSTVPAASPPFTPPRHARHYAAAAAPTAHSALFSDADSDSDSGREKEKEKEEEEGRGMAKSHGSRNRDFSPSKSVGQGRGAVDASPPPTAAAEAAELRRAVAELSAAVAVLLQDRNGGVRGETVADAALPARQVLSDLRRLLPPPPPHAQGHPGGDEVWRGRDGGPEMSPGVGADSSMASRRLAEELRELRLGQAALQSTLRGLFETAHVAPPQPDLSSPPPLAADPSSRREASGGRRSTSLATVSPPSGSDAVTRCGGGHRSAREKSTRSVEHGGTPPTPPPPPPDAPREERGRRRRRRRRQSGGDSSRGTNTHKDDRHSGRRPRPWRSGKSRDQSLVAEDAGVAAAVGRQPHSHHRHRKGSEPPSADLRADRHHQRSKRLVSSHSLTSSSGTASFSSSSWSPSRSSPSSSSSFISSSPSSLSSRSRGGKNHRRRHRPHNSERSHHRRHLRRLRRLRSSSNSTREERVAAAAQAPPAPREAHSDVAPTPPPPPGPPPTGPPPPPALSLSPQQRQDTRRTAPVILVPRFGLSRDARTQPQRDERLPSTSGSPPTSRQERSPPRGRPPQSTPIVQTPPPPPPPTTSPSPPAPPAAVGVGKGAVGPPINVKQRIKTREPRF